MNGKCLKKKNNFGKKNFNTHTRERKRGRYSVNGTIYYSTEIRQFGYNNRYTYLFMNVCALVHVHVFMYALKEIIAFFMYRVGRRRKFWNSSFNFYSRKKHESHDDLIIFLIVLL